MSCGVGRRPRSDPTLLWLWCRPAATAPIRPLAWEPPYATGTALNRPNKQIKKPRSSLGRGEALRASRKHADPWSGVVGVGVPHAQGSIERESWPGATLCSLTQRSWSAAAPSPSHAVCQPGVSLALGLAGKWVAGSCPVRVGLNSPLSCSCLQITSGSTARVSSYSCSSGFPSARS